MSELDEFSTFQEFKESDLYKTWYEAMRLDNPDTLIHILELSLYRYYNQMKGIEIPEYPKEEVKIEPEQKSADVLTVDEWNLKYNYLKDMSSGSNITADTVCNQINIIKEEVELLPILE
jgi:phosphodiesterase/alkaline phosphatase D-like protein